MAISLKKGQGVSLRKSEFDLSSVTIGLGWDVATEKKGFFKALFGKDDADYDLDAIAFLLDGNGKVRLGSDAQGNVALKDSDVVFYNNMRHQGGAIWLTGDNRTGAGDGDDEQIIVRLDDIETRHERIVFIVAIYQGRQKGQNFGKVKNAFIRAVDARGQEICRYDISGTAAFAQYCSITFAEVARKDGGWEFRALGEPHETDRFTDLLSSYI